MATLFARHSVTDYEAWRKVCDEYYPVRQRFGVTGEALFRSADDPNDIMVMLDFATVERARAFTNDAEFRTALQKAGVTGAPTTWFTSRV